MKFLMVLFLCLSCSDDMPKISSLDKLKTIALIADFPEINEAGGNVSITPWIADPLGGSRTIDLYWSQCPDPGIAYGVEPKCVGASETLMANQVLTSQDRTEALLSFTVTIPSGLTTLRSARDQFNGVYYLISLRIVAGSEEIKAYKRIRVSTKSGADLNTNPTLTGLTFDGSLPAFPSNKMNVKGTIGNGAETFQYLDSDGNNQAQLEELTISFFTTSGNMDPSIVEANDSSKIIIKDNPSQLTVIGVIRDQRGGIGIIKEEF